MSQQTHADNQTCFVPECNERGEVVTPEGILCPDHADALYAEEREA